MKMEVQKGDPEKIEVILRNLLSSKPRPNGTLKKELGITDAEFERLKKVIESHGKGEIASTPYKDLGKNSQTEEALQIGYFQNAYSDSIKKEADESAIRSLGAGNAKRENFRYWITTAIALLALAVSVFTMLGGC